MSPNELRVGDHIVTERTKNGKVAKQFLVRKLEACPSRTRGVGATHVNETQCYDNVADLDVIKSLPPKPALPARMKG